MDGSKNYIYKERDSGSKELFSMLIYRKLANILLLNVFKNLSVTPNQISFISLVIVAAGSYFFAFTEYPYILIGALLLHIGYVFDMLDGQYARYKGLSSKFGQWFDPFLDVIKVTFIFISLSYGAYVSTDNPAVFMWGLVAMANSFLTCYIMNTRSQVFKSKGFEIKLKKDIYVGYEITLYLALTFFIVFNIVYQGLIFMATIGALSWIKVYVTLRRNYLKHKEEIEKTV